MNLLLIASTVFTLLTLYFVFSMFRHARRRRPVRATRSLAGGTVSACAGGASIMLAFSYFGYLQLVDEQLIGRIKFTESAPEQYVARLMLEDEAHDRMFEILATPKSRKSSAKIVACTHCPNPCPWTSGSSRANIPG